MSNTRKNNSEPDGKLDSANGIRRPYNKPRVLSAERLEAAAATCEPATPPFGKTVGPFSPCTTLGS